MRQVLFLVVLLAILPSASAQTRPSVEGSVDNPVPYVGEPIIYSLKLYYQGTIGDSTVTDPDFIGVGRSSIILEPLIYTEMLEGINYNVIEQRYVLYPLRSGELTIEPFQVDISETPFDPAWLLFTDSVTLTVQDYPEPMPETFINGVGQFSISASASPINVQTNETLSLEIAVSGTGNLEQLLAPEINLPENWQLFDARITYEQDNLRFGTKIFSWTVLVGDDSLSALPAVLFSYFNPQAEQYESRTTAPIPLSITVVTAQSDVTIERTPEILATVAPPALLSPNASLYLPAHPPNWFWYLWVLPPLLWLFVWGIEAVINRPKRIRQYHPSKRTRSRALQTLLERLRLIDYTKPFEAYSALSEQLFTYLSHKANEAITENNLHIITEKLPEKLELALIACVEDAGSGQYAPITEADARALKARILGVCEAIETVLV